MRKPKYRAWIKDGNRMLPVGDLDMSYKLVYLEENNGYRCERNFDEVDLMEFTGLKDKNDVEIYEGDIVRYIDGDKEILCPVRYIEKYACFGVEWGHDLSATFEHLESFYIKPHNFEVVGNIYENKDLLGE